MKNATVPRKHHYVPQVYLKNFLIPHEKGERVYVYDKERDYTYKSSIEKIAVEKDFHTIKDAENPYYWEEFYSNQIETRYRDILGELQSKCIISTKDSDILDDELKARLSFIICSQLFRTRKAREFQHYIGQRVAKEVISQVKDTNKKGLSQEHLEYLNNFKLTEELLKEISLPTINDSERFIKCMSILLNKNWIVFYNGISDLNPFIASDNPVCYYNFSTKQTSFEENGLAVPTTIIYFPITSKILIALYPEKFYLGFLKPINGKMHVIKEEKFIGFVNNLQLEQCYRQAYSSRNNYLVF